MLVLAALAIASRAGVWAVSYSGGTTGVCPDHNPPPPAGAETVVCQGAVTVTFTWVPQGPGDTVPSVVVLRKEATASWSGGNSGSSDNGLGDPAVGGVSSGVHFEVVQSPTSPIIRTITPTANVSATPPPNDVGTASVVVTCSVIVPSLNFAGTTNSQAGSSPTWHNILVGQQLTATVALGGLPTEGQDTYTWTVSAGAPLNGYTTTATFGQRYGFAPPNEKSASWHFAIGEFGNPLASDAGKPSTVSCVVVLKAPEPDLAFTVTKDLRIFEPKVNTGLTMSFGTVQLFPNPSAPTHLFLIGLPWPNGNEVGAIWTANVERVSFFDQLGTMYEKGKWGVFQLAIGKLEWQRAGDPLRKNANYNLWGLDSGVPYNGSAGEHDLDGNDHEGSDTPGINAPDIGGTEWAKIDYGFHTTLMFRPPGSSAVWVPLQSPRAWFAKGTATNVPPWELAGNDQGMSPTQIPFRVFFNWVGSIQDGTYWVPPWP